MSEKSFLDKKSYKILVIISSVLSLLPIIAGILLYDKIPETVPTHFDFRGNADAYSSKNIVIFAMPIIFLVMNLFSSVKLYYDPFDQNKTNKSPILIKITLLSIPIMSCWTFITTYLYSVYNSKLGIYILAILLGLLFIAIGNYMPKNKQNSVMGVRTAWALKDEKNWNKVNKLGGFCFVLMGLVMLITGILLFLRNGNAPSYFEGILFVSIIISVFIPTIYSFILYKKENK